MNRARGTPASSPDTTDAFLDGLGPFTRLELSVEVPLWTFGRISSGIEAAEMGVESARASLEGKRLEVTFGVKKLYYGIQLTRRIEAILRDMIDTMDKAITTTEARLATGGTEVSEVDLLRLHLGRAKLAKGAVEASAATAASKDAIARAIGALEPDEFEIADDMPAPVEPELESVDAYVAEVSERSAEWRALAAGIAAQSAKIAVEEAAHLPSLALSAGVIYAWAGNRDDQKNPFAFDELNVFRPVLVLALHWDLTYFKIAARSSAERAALERLFAERRELASGIVLRVRNAHAEVRKAKELLEHMADARKAGRTLLVLAVSNFDLGIGDAKTLFEALTDYTEASVEHLRAVYAFDLAVGELSRAVGREVATKQDGPPP